MPDRYIQLVPVGDLAIDEIVLIEFQAIVDNQLLEGKPKIKSTKIDYLYQPASKGKAIASTVSNQSGHLCGLKNPASVSLNSTDCKLTQSVGFL